jgi:hypothetical protein
MSADQILLTIITISAFCLGLRTITDDGMILWFARKPYDYTTKILQTIAVDIYNNKKLRESCGKEKQIEIQWTLDCLRTEKIFFKVLLYLMKPIIGCCACFASVWGLFVFYSLNGLSTDLWKEIIICCISASFINYFCWTYLEKKL